ncbi:MAG: sodium-dependent transporter [Acidobacteria bacterium]|nr:sodium-dependent transporter [Acidobacteriota bacterium]
MAAGVQLFSSRWGLMLAMLGMAVGTGNIWRFPRIAASNGGGSFLVAWVVFLMLWSVPLILAEFALGKKVRNGTVGTFAAMMGERFAWMGAWIAWVAAAIGFYYAVVMGWTLRYFLAAITMQLQGERSVQLWEEFSYTPQVLIFHALALAMGVIVVLKGIRGIESVVRILMPALLVLVVVLAIRAVTLPGAVNGLEFLFRPNWSDLLDSNIWLQALTQNAWDTGAGWGLVLTYAVFSRRREDTNLNSFLLAFGNNSVSLLAGVMVLCTVFSIMPGAANQIVGASNEGLTFIWIPQLFNAMPGGSFFMILFFMALVFAAWTSLVAMFQLVGLALEEAGLERRKAIISIAVAAFALGVPSALWQSSFVNQDTVWSVALMFCGLFFALIVIRYGVTRFRAEMINTGDQDMRVGAWWDWAIRLVAIEAVVLVAWMIWSARNEPLWGPLGVGNMFGQWIVVAAVLIALNGVFLRGLRKRAQGSG